VVLELYSHIKDKSEFLVSAIINVLHHIFRKEPKTSLHLNALEQITESLLGLTEPQARQSGVWILGEFLPHKPELLRTYTDNLLHYERGT
jgi:hypothetical protein